jgi:hypothetical protein
MACVQGTAIQREMMPIVPYLLLYGLKIFFGIESMNALPALAFSNEALMRLMGFNAQQVRHGVCQRGAAKRQHPRTEGPICPDTLATNIMQLNLRDLTAWFNGTIRALAKAGIFCTTVTGIVDTIDLETEASPDRGYRSRTWCMRSSSSSRAQGKSLGFRSGSLKTGP